MPGSEPPEMQVGDPVSLAFDYRPNPFRHARVRRAIEQARPWGVDACSRIEISPGKKDHVRMAQFLKAALSS